jgi:hypothetical protein
MSDPTRIPAQLRTFSVNALLHASAVMPHDGLLLNFLLIFVAGKNSVNEIPDLCYNLPKLETPSNEALHEFIDVLNEEKPYNPTIQVIR